MTNLPMFARMKQGHTYRVAVGGAELRAWTEGNVVIVDDVPVPLIDGETLYSLSPVGDHDGTPIAVEPGENDHEYVVYMRGEAITVRLTTPRDERLLALRRSAARPGGGGLIVRAPMPGLLKAVLVSEGEIVAKGTSLCILEAMKMENELKAPDRLRVARIAAQSGTAVDKGAPLVELVSVEVE